MTTVPLPTLRQYQVDIAERACTILDNHGIVLLTMQVRTGKTLTSLAICQRQGYARVLFVTKKAVIEKIKDEYRKFGFTFDFVVTNYESLHNFESTFDAIIVDEHHSIGAYPKPSKRAQELRRLVGDKPVILLSGSPTPESFSQAYHALWISERSPWRKYKNFFSWFAEYGTRKTMYMYNREFFNYDNAHQDKVMKDLEPMVLTYTQEEAGFQNKVEHHVLSIPAPDVIHWAVKKLQKDKVIITKDGYAIVADTAVKEQGKVHQIWSGTIKTEEEVRIIISDYKAKFITERFIGQKIAIFYKYIAEGDMLRRVFGKRVAVDPLHFNASSDAVYISQIISGREGIDLSSADALVMFNIDFAALSYLQAPDRINTRDRSRPAPIYWIVAENGIEEKILETVRKKEDFTLRHYLKTQNR